MKNRNTNAFGRVLDKVYGGLNMSWPMVILFAVLTAALTAVFLIVPLFKGTSFERMGVYLEAWFFFAIIIMANCKKPLESALKVFIFFLVSQPLIYLFQVPFSAMGIGLFGYYRYWFIWTILTFPMAFIGWFINKKNWLSVLILSPVICFLAAPCVGAFRDTYYNFPYLLVTGLFCLFQIVIYIIVFFKGGKKRAVGVIVAAAALIFFLSRLSGVSLSGTNFLPDEPELSSGAYVEVEDPSIANVDLTEPEEDLIYISAHKYGTTFFTIKDQGQEYRYRLEVYYDKGTDRILIEPAE